MTDLNRDSVVFNSVSRCSPGDTRVADSIMRQDSQFCLCTNGVFRAVTRFSNQRAVYRCLNCNLHQIFPYTAQGNSPDPVTACGEFYNKISEREYYGYFMVFYDALRALQIPKGARILDFGAGRCYYAKFLQQQGYRHVVSVEINQPMVEFARHTLGLDQVHTNLAEAGEAPFDLILANQVFEHVYNPVDLLSNDFYGRLRTGGHIVFAVPNYGSYNRVLLGKRWIGYSPDEHIWMFDPSSAARLFGRMEEYELLGCRVRSSVNSRHNAFVPSSFVKKIYYNTFMRLFEWLGKGDQILVILRKK